MKEAKFQIGEIVSESWQKMLKNIGFFILVILIYGVLSGSMNFGNRETNYPILMGGFGLIGLILSIIVNVGILKITLQIIDDKKASLDELFLNYKKAWRYFLAGLLVGLIVLLGLILLIVPGIYWALKYQFVGYLIIDKDLSISEALHESGRLTRGYKWQLLLFHLLLGLINLAGALALGLGLFLTTPTVWLAQAKAYRTLSKE